MVYIQGMSPSGAATWCRQSLMPGAGGVCSPCRYQDADGGGCSCRGASSTMLLAVGGLVVVAHPAVHRWESRVPTRRGQPPSRAAWMYNMSMGGCPDLAA